MFITFVESVFLVDPATVNSFLEPLVIRSTVIPFFSMLEYVLRLSSITICFLDVERLIELLLFSYINKNVPFCSKMSKAASVGMCFMIFCLLILEDALMFRWVVALLTCCCFLSSSLIGFLLRVPLGLKSTFMNVFCGCSLFCEF